MIYWIIFIITGGIFVHLFRKEKRDFKNAIFFAISLLNLFLGISFSTSGSIISGLITGFLFFLVPLALMFMSFAFISAGIISIKRQGFSLAHSLAIIFGIGIWSPFISIIGMALGHEYFKIAFPLFTLILLISGYVLFTFFSLFIYSQVCMFIPKKLDSEYIIVHGAGLIEGRYVTPLLAGRLDKAIQIYKAMGKTAKIIVSGGKGSDEHISEAEAMKNYLVEQLIDEEDIILEDKSTTTYENMLFSKRIMDDIKDKYKVIFVTSDYHVFRTGLYAKQVGLKAEGVGSKTALFYWPNAFIREYLAIIVKYKAMPIVLFILWLLGTLLITFLGN